MTTRSRSSASPLNKSLDQGQEFSSPTGGMLQSVHQAESYLRAEFLVPPLVSPTAVTLSASRHSISGADSHSALALALAPQNHSCHVPLQEEEVEDSPARIGSRESATCVMA